MNLKRILAVMLILILAITPMSVMAAFTDTTEELGASSFTPRLTAPSKSNSYYYSNNNIFYSIGYGMPNCTAYAWGRAYELLGTQPKLSVNSAHYWYDYNKENNYYPYGQTPKLGAIACWDNADGGHVAVVENITSTTVTLSHSEWGGRTFFTTEHSINASNGGAVSSGWTFEGYIYILDGEILPDGDIYKVDSGNGLNMRKGAGTNYSVLVSIPNKTELVVTETKTANGYTWGKTTYAGYTGWCVLDFCRLVYKLPEVTEPPTTEPETQPPATEATEPTQSTEPPAEATWDEPEVTLPEDDAEAPSNAILGSTEPTAPSDGAAERPADWGDVNNDGNTNVSDATMLQKYVAGLNVPLSLEKADVNGDGKVTVADATYIQKIIAGIDVPASC